MIKNVARVLLAGALVCVFSEMSMAQGGGGRTSRPGATSRPTMDRGLTAMLKEFKLTDEQTTRVEGMFKTYRESVTKYNEEHAKDFTAAMDKVKAAREKGDKEAIVAAEADVRKLVEGRKALQENFLKQLSEVLNKEQLDKVKAYLESGAGRPGPMAQLSQLNLTDEQKKKIADILDIATEEARLAGPQGGRKIMDDAMAKIKKEVLTEEQVKKLESLATSRPAFDPAAMYNAAAPTDEQKAKIKEIMDAATAEAQKSPDKRREIMRAAMDKVRNDVMTEEQRKKLDEARPTGGFGGGRPGRGGNGGGAGGAGGGAGGAGGAGGGN